MNEHWWSETNDTAKAIIIFQGIFVIIMCVCNTFLYYIIETSNIYMYNRIATIRTRNNSNRITDNSNINLAQ